MQCPKLSISLVGLPRETKRLFKSPKVLLQPSFSLPPGALTICMENPKIPGKIRMEWFTRVEIFRKKSNTFRGITETTEIFCSICLDYQYQASSREKAKNLAVSCKWYNTIFLFSVPKKYQYHLTEFFHRISLQMVSAPGQLKNQRRQVFPRSNKLNKETTTCA